ncbi:peptidoglycan editing factor PgeF [Thalassotalea sp. G2M2-11]|uniref:peptidoglycan editing factor PgeF n=1 Tax=Thalassotalea sp. G2M2-11 TaxID=2787627 RepID=UPI0019D17976|nr:peptidoglycan editing factor PgeF [Thalassotalea sp. G2M2-11]
MSNSSFNNAFDHVELPVKNIQAIQTTRLALAKSISNTPPFHSFNLGLHVGDDKKQVESNRQQLLSCFPQYAKIQWLEQIHGTNVAVINAHHQQAIIADAVVTQTPRLALAIMTADCLPILLTNQAGTEIAAIHGGWRPLAGNIIAQTLDKMSSDSTQIIAWLGPCIGNTAFEVGNEVKQAFLTLSAKFESCFIASKDDKWLADLVAIASIMLKQQGVEQVINGHHCTYSNTERYYSYRKHQQTGRMASIICIK